MIALPRSATKALKLWSWKDAHTRDHGLDSSTPKSSLDTPHAAPEQLKDPASEPIANGSPIVRTSSKLVKKRDPLGHESTTDTALPVPDVNPTAPDSRPATPATSATPLSADSETAEHVVVPENLPRPPTPKPNVLVKRNSLSKRAAAKAPDAPVPDLPDRDTTDVAETRDRDKPAGEQDVVPGTTSTSQIELEPVQTLTFPARGPTPPTGTRFFENADGELEPTESRTTGTGGATSARKVFLRPARPQRRISLRSFGFFYGQDSRPTTGFPAYVPPTERIVYEEPEAEVNQPARTHKKANSLLPTGLLNVRKPAAPRPTRSDKRAIESAMSLRTLIIGPAALDPKNAQGKRPSDSKASAALALRKVNQQLLVPAEANRVIAALRELPPPDLPPATAERVETVRRKKGWMFGRVNKGEDSRKHEPVKPSEGTVAIPIHGCCLDVTDEEAEAKHFSKLTGSGFVAQGSGSTAAGANIGSADLSSLIPVLKNLKLVNLQSSPDMSSMNAASLTADLTAPDLGFGQPANKHGLLAGSVPSASNLADGMEKVGQTLMSLGFATTAAVLPSHVGIHPPKDRMSVLTYWWGYEVIFPPPTMRFLGHAKSISGALLNFLTAFSLFSNGVREMLPFIRYIAQFIDFEWDMIKAQDQGRGVVCAATWVMPAALVPRPWDFVDPPMMGGMLPRNETPGTAFMPITTTSADASAREVVDVIAFAEVRDAEAGIENVESLELRRDSQIETTLHGGGTNTSPTS